jgi:hypothetical protein
MNSLMHDPDHWRRRADECRCVASQMTDVESKNAMLEIAAECDKLARKAEDRAATLGGAGATSRLSSALTCQLRTESK